MSDNKNVTKERHRWTKAERQYIKGIVQNYSLQRWTDQDIVDYLREEKKIKIGRSTVTKIKNQVEQEAENWYIELRESGSKYVAVYKERLDSLLSYQKKLHELCNSESSPELVLRAISELHKIEMSLHTLMKELPGDIKTSKDKTEENDREKEKTGHLTFDEWINKYPPKPRISDDTDYTDEENGQYYWGLHKKYNEYVKQRGNSMFGPDPAPDSVWGDTELPKSIVRLPDPRPKTAEQIPTVDSTTNAGKH
jgi:hypothetical protein